jgi:hypothetical protein
MLVASVESGYPALDAAGEMPIAGVAESDPITLTATGTKPAVL